MMMARPLDDSQLEGRVEAKPTLWVESISTPTYNQRSQFPLTIEHGWSQYLSSGRLIWPFQPLDSINMASLQVKSVLITGANRGLGLQFVKKFLASSPPPEYIFATYRNDQGALSELAEKNKNIRLLKLDVNDFGSFSSFAKKIDETVGDIGLTLLINNAGLINRESKLEDVCPDKMLELFRVNTIAPLELTKALLPSLKKAGALVSGDELSVNRGAVVTITSKMGSIADNGSGGYYAYRCSKVAVNMANVSLAKELKEYGLMSVVLHPGWVQTDMGGARAIHTIHESIDGMVATLAALGTADNGGFFDFKGNTIPW